MEVILVNSNFSLNGLLVFKLIKMSFSNYIYVVSVSYEKYKKILQIFIMESNSKNSIAYDTLFNNTNQI